MEGVFKVYKIKGGKVTEVFFSSQEAAENAVKTNPARYSFSSKVDSIADEKEPAKESRKKKKESEDSIADEKENPESTEDE